MKSPAEAMIDYLADELAEHRSPSNPGALGMTISGVPTRDGVAGIDVSDPLGVYTIRLEAKNGTEAERVMGAMLSEIDEKGCPWDVPVLARQMAGYLTTRLYPPDKGSLTLSGRITAAIQARCEAMLKDLPVSARALLVDATRYTPDEAS